MRSACVSLRLVTIHPSHTLPFILLSFLCICFFMIFHFFHTRKVVLHAYFYQNVENYYLYSTILKNQLASLSNLLTQK